MSLIDIKNLSFAYDGSAEKVFDNVSFQSLSTPAAFPQASALITSRSRCMTRRAPRRKRSRRS